MARTAELHRVTKETDIALSLTMDTQEGISIETGIPFMDHMLNSMAFHGRLGLKVKATGDLAVDYHHTVEDIGIVLGQALAKIVEDHGPVMRFGFSSIPMDDALSQATIDVCNRAYLVHQVNYPQAYSGVFDMSLFREFFLALANNARINLHLITFHGENSHHISESLFKALGRAVSQAYAAADNAGGIQSTKGVL
jgi:imidazoleglycerol-phosphate dehydratase